VVEALLPFYAILWELYKNFRPILFDSVRVKFDKGFRKLETDVYEEYNRIVAARNDRRLINPSMELIRKLDDMQIKLLEIRQIIGLGIQVYKEETLKKKLERALGVSHD